MAMQEITRVSGKTRIFTEKSCISTLNEPLLFQGDEHLRMKSLWEQNDITMLSQMRTLAGLEQGAMVTAA